MFAEKATVKQLEWLGKIRERENYTGIGFKMVCKAIIEEYGVPWAMSKVIRGRFTTYEEALALWREGIYVEDCLPTVEEAEDLPLPQDWQPGDIGPGPEGEY